MKKILIVDDEEKVRKLIEITLSIGEFEVLQASTGEECVKIAQETGPDIILLDVTMPGELDGLDACRLLKKDPATKDCYVIMLTAKGQQVDKEKGFAMGADDYFIKPFSPMELIDKLNKITSQKV